MELMRNDRPHPDYDQILIDCHFHKIIVESVIDLPYTQFIDTEDTYFKEFHDRALQEIPINPSFRKALTYIYMVDSYGVLFDLQRATLTQHVNTQRGVMGNLKVRFSMFLVVAVVLGFGLGIVYPNPINMLFAAGLAGATLAMCISIGFDYFIDPDHLNREILSHVNYIAKILAMDQDVTCLLLCDERYRDEVKAAHERLVRLIKGTDIN